MFKHFLTMAMRTFIRNKLTSLINLFGLTIGFSCCIVITLYIVNELSTLWRVCVMNNHVAGFAPGNWQRSA